MARLPSAFNSEDHGEMGYPTFPSGKYSMRITDTAYEKNKKKNGHFLKIEFTIIDGKYEGSKYFQRLNLDNPNHQAVEIAQRELATLCRAVGLVMIEDSDELHGCELTVELVLKKAQGEYPESNNVRGYTPLEGASRPSAGGRKNKLSESKPEAPKRRRRPMFEDDEDEEDEEDSED